MHTGVERAPFQVSGLRGTEVALHRPPVPPRTSHDEVAGGDGSRHRYAINLLILARLTRALRKPRFRTEGSTSERSTLWRVAALVALAFHLGVTTLVPLADAQVDGTTPATAHVEAAGTEGCPAEHDHLACHFCRSIQAQALPGDARAEPAIASDLPNRFPPPCTVLRPARLAGGDGARAPPPL